MNDYKFESRKYKRGEYCLAIYKDINGDTYGFKCGCGSRTPPSKKYKIRIIRRSLKNQLMKEMGS